jgi:hypothetical protein
MLNEKTVANLERKLTDLAQTYYDSRNAEVKERNRGYCQGIAFALSEIGYSVEWDNGKAFVVKND